MNNNPKETTSFWLYPLVLIMIISAMISLHAKLNLFRIESLAFWGFFGGIIALLFAVYLINKVTKAPCGNDKMVKISSFIYKGAMAFLGREYRILFFFVLIVFILLSYFIGWKTGVCFLVGSWCSATAGFIGMTVSTMANSRVAQAATNSLKSALNVAFSGGAVMGMAVVGLGLIGLSILYLIFQDPSIVNGFALGGSSIALFARVGGGIYTKAADVGADLVGKIEAGIPEDDPRNPAVIADNVGDNVGDVAGMGADLFESFVGSIIAAMTLGLISFGLKGAALPILIASAGAIAAIIGILYVNFDKSSAPMKTLHRGTLVSSALMLLFSYGIIGNLMHYHIANRIYFALVIGLFVGILIGYTTEYYTSSDYKHVKKISEASSTGSATNIIAGLGVGMLSTFMPIIFICIGIVLAYSFTGVYGISIAALGMLATIGMIVAVDAYGPISDNAGGIAEMTHMDNSVREITDKLDSVGNTTAAIGKGFAIGSAALTSLALLTAFTKVAGLDTINILKPIVIMGVLFGASLPFIFSAFTMDAVGRAASKMVDEVRRQFKEITGLMEGKAEPDYTTCVDISTKAALKEMVVPGALAIAVPIGFGLGFGAEALAGMLTGAIASGVCLAIMMANAGGAWDNAKKYIETGFGGGKGSISHAAAVTGDTVGDPCKDTSGPSLNILLKLMTIVSLVFASLFA